ncbi:MAG: SEC-C metal-binding domain-containing protein [Proteobacteria bacterium]|nr:SEC-C metal-binding domain-containing protein [Pseudomonadota bacterium]
MNIGRNDPCLCGSGKKYKKCCLSAANLLQAEDLSYKRYREIESELIGRLFRYALEIFGPTAIEEAWSEFHCWDDSEAYDPESPINQIFGPYFLFSWEIDPANTECDLALSAKTVTDAFLETQRPRLSQEEINILDAANHCNFSFYEFTDVSPGRGFTLRNVLTELEYNVIERLGSQGAKRGFVIFGAIFEVNGSYQTLAMSPYPLPPMAIQPLIDLRKNLQKRLKTKKPSDTQVSEFNIELREVYFELLEPVLNPQMPKFCNTDGDPLVPQTLYFEITSPAHAFAKLKSLTEGIMSEEELRSSAKLEGGEVCEAEIPWFKKPNAKAKLGSNTVLGRIRIIGKKLKIEVNSDKRAKAIKKKIETALGVHVKFVTTVIESVEGNIGRAPNQVRPDPSPIPLGQLPPEALEAVKKMANDHWTKWLDDKIPALNGMTPKHAAKTKEGRELLEALLNSYENRSGHDTNSATNLFRPDIQDLRKKLGLS